MAVEGCFGVGVAVTVRYDAAAPRRFEIQGWDATTADRVFALVGSLLTGATLLALLIRLLIRPLGLWPSSPACGDRPICAFDP